MRKCPQRRKLITYLAGYLLMILSIVIFSCREEVPIDRLESLVNKQFLKVLPPNQVTPEHINIAVDISESMRGFARTRTFEDLLRRTFTCPGPSISVRYFWFDTTFGELVNYERFFDANFFSGVAANFQRAFSIRNSRTNEILILITDFQFNNNLRYLELVRIFQTEINNGSYIKIFSARPDFEGRIFPQFIQRQRFWYTGNRPLYAICIGEMKHAKFIEDVLKRIMPWENSLTLTSQIPVDWKIFHPSPSVLITGKSLLLSSRDSISFKLRIISPAILDWGQWATEEIISEAYLYGDSMFIPSKENLFIRKVQSNRDTVTIELFGREINPIPTKLWRISLRPQSVPTWISDQSCNPDGDQASRTVRLREFIEDVIRPVTNPFTVATINIFLQKN